MPGVKLEALFVLIELLNYQQIQIAKDPDGLSCLLEINFCAKVIGKLAY